MAGARITGVDRSRICTFIGRCHPNGWDERLTGIWFVFSVLLGGGRSREKI